MKPLVMTPRQARLLALSLLAGAILLVLAIVAAPVIWLNHRYNQAIEQQIDLLGRYSRIGATGPELGRQLAALKARGTRTFFLKSTVPALAASEVQEIAKGIIESNGGKIASMQIPEHKDDAGFRKVTVSIQMTAAVSATQKIFHALETQRPYFMLDNVSIRSTAWRQAPRSTNAPGPEPEYAVQFDVTGYAVLGGK